MKYYINGVLVRTSDRAYTHAVISKGKPGAVGGFCLHCCCGRNDLAQKALDDCRRRLAHRPETVQTLRIVELEVKK